jgi:vacuolar-type H+-ATPase subunit H
MSTDTRFDGNGMLQALQLNKAGDEDLLAFISSLIDQNSELERKLQKLIPQKELVDKIIEDAHKQGREILLSAEKEAQVRAAAIISEAETKAKLEAERIIAEANQKVEDIVKDKVQSAIYQGSVIIDKAQERADSILEDARAQAESISNRANKKVKR